MPDTKSGRSAQSFGVPPLNTLRLVLTFVAALCCLNPLHVYGSSDCNMVTTADKKGKDANGNLVAGVTTSAECSTHCLSDEQCVAVSFSTFCFKWTDLANVIASPGNSIDLKQCTSPTTSPSVSTAASTAAPTATCSVAQTVNTDFTSADVVLELDEKSCQTACKVTSQCQHYVFLTGSRECRIYVTSSVTKTSEAGSNTGSKKPCDGNGHSCCFDLLQGINVSESPALSLTTSQSSCENMCLQVSSCVAVVFTGSSCKLVTKSGFPTTPSSGATLSEKSCPQGANRGSVTYTDVCSSKASVATSWIMTVLVAVMISVYTANL